MNGKFIGGIVLGTAVGLMMMPKLKRSTKRRIVRADNAIWGIFSAMRPMIKRKKMMFN